MRFKYIISVVWQYEKEGACCQLINTLSVREYTKNGKMTIFGKFPKFNFPKNVRSLDKKTRNVIASNN